MDSEGERNVFDVNRDSASLITEFQDHVKAYDWSGVEDFVVASRNGMLIFAEVCNQADRKKRAQGLFCAIPAF